VLFYLQVLHLFESLVGLEHLGQRGISLLDGLDTLSDIILNVCGVLLFTSSYSLILFCRVSKVSKLEDL